MELIDVGLAVVVWTSQYVGFLENIEKSIGPYAYAKLQSFRNYIVVIVRVVCDLDLIIIIINPLLRSPLLEASLHLCHNIRNNWEYGDT